MNNDNRIVEFLTDTLHVQKKTNERLVKLEKQQAKTNIVLADMRLADKFELYANLENSVSNLERFMSHK